MDSDYSIVFVCQQGELEVKAALLAASLRSQLGDRLELIAATPVPQQQWGTPSHVTAAFLERLGVRLAPIHNSIDVEYGYGNKIPALGVEAASRSLLFLDSDILCLQPPRFDELSGDLAAKPADLGTWGSEADSWAAVYRLFGLEFPCRRVETTISGQVSPPYFNAGVIAVADAAAFSECWEDSCIRIDRESMVSNKRPWLDQIALPIAISRLGLKFRPLTNRHNFPAHLMPLQRDLPVFCHYHWPNILKREPALIIAVGALTHQYPGLDEILDSGGDEWRNVLERAHGRARNINSAHGLPPSASPLAKSVGPGSCPEFLVSGIPRSGTSLLCRLLHQQEDVVIVNEPLAIHAPLGTCENPWWIGTHYRDLRRDILEGQGIENRVVGGQLVDDTYVEDVRSDYLPRIGRPDFLLGTKNTLAYMARIELLRRVMPDAPIVVCVRNPIDTLASWKGSFPHLRDADLNRFPVDYRNHGFLTRNERERLQRIADTESVIQRRAMIWAYLADMALKHRDSVFLVRYEDLIRNPRDELKRILDVVPGFDAPGIQVDLLAPRSRRELLDRDELDAIADHCGTQAEALGYRL